MDAFIEERFARTAFRLEVLPRYTVDSDQGNVENYLAGAAEPSWANGGPWFDHLAAERATGKRRYRVHIIEPPLSDYLRYECEWGYVYTTAAGEEVYILDTSETPLPTKDLVDHDWWLLDDEHVLRMHYDPEGRFLGAEPLSSSSVGPYLACRDAVMKAAVPFEAWWDAHPQYKHNGQDSAL
ncbi:DUF6879 family protein [Streptosporangium subroseum]|uniref:DUF6879 family protein n=1 Tax=Streptosporangium subroseum TaxID=106412 RepID=UPI003086CA92|nr:hypothetical protein OHB15_09460 [Streptosporangium subroseum]